MKQIFLLLLVFCAVLFWGCPKPRTYIPIPDEVKAYVVFPVGSYWIYTDSLSDQLDSVCITAVLSRIGSEPESRIDPEIIQMAQESSYYGDSVRGGVEILSPLLPKQFMYSMNSGFTNFFCCTGYFNGEEQPTFEPYKSGFDAGYTKYVGYWEDYVVGNQVYHKVRAYQTVYELPRNPIRRYYAAEVGLIRAEMKDGKIWKLERYKIAP